MAGTPASPDVATPLLLSVRGVNAGYGDAQVLWDVSLELRPGEVVALVGAQWRGQVYLAFGPLGPRAGLVGIIELGRPDITRMAAERIVRRGLAHVPQGRHLFSGLSVEENLRLGAYTRAREQPPPSRTISNVSTPCCPSCVSGASRLAGLLSGGEQQMVAIGRGLMARPTVLLIDELSLGLAPTIVDDLLAAIDTIHREEGLTFLLVEQDVQIALERADRGYVIENGRIVLSGPGNELLTSDAIRTAYLGIVTREREIRRWWRQRSPGSSATPRPLAHDGRLQEGIDRRVGWRRYRTS